MTPGGSQCFSHVLPLDPQRTFAAVLRSNYFSHQDGARRPFATETKSHQRSEDQELRIVLREAAKQREEGEPEDRDL